MSAQKSISVSIDNLTFSRLTIKYADIAKVFSEYIRNQILQQASVTLLTTVNQSKYSYTVAVMQFLYPFR